MLWLTPFPIRIAVPKPVRKPNRCNLEPFNPETPRIELYLVLARARVTLQVVCLGLAHFRLPVRPPKAPFRPTRENPGRPRVDVLGGGPCQMGRCRRIFSAARRSSMPATTRMGPKECGMRSAECGIGPRARPAESSPGPRDGHARRGGLPHLGDLGRCEGVGLVDEDAASRSRWTLPKIAHEKPIHAIPNSYAQR